MSEAKPPKPKASGKDAGTPGPRPAIKVPEAKSHQLVVLCAARPPLGKTRNDMSLCDRKQSHAGLHSWELEEIAFNAEALVHGWRKDVETGVFLELMDKLKALVGGH